MANVLTGPQFEHDTVYSSVHEIMSGLGQLINLTVNFHKLTVMLNNFNFTS